MTYSQQRTLYFGPSNLIKRLINSTPVLMFLVILLIYANTLQCVKFIHTTTNAYTNNENKEINETSTLQNNLASIAEPIVVEQTNITSVQSSYEDANTEEPVMSPTTMYCNSIVNVREEPTIESTCLETVNFGTEFTVTDLKNGWYTIEYNDSQAFIREDLLSSEFPALMISSTAYWDAYGLGSASSRTLTSNHSLAGMVSWLGKSVNMYACNADGSIGDFIGTYTFDDTGYGQETGSGSSQILEGKSIGTIENGTCIDIYMNSEDDCYAYGRQNVYIQFIN